jgi:uncharacterized damage-inducible protein DinB
MFKNRLGRIRRRRILPALDSGFGRPKWGAYNSAPRRAILSRMSAPKTATTRPEPTEYAAFYEKYVALVPGNDIVAILDAQRLQMAQLFAARSERDGNFRYAADKWTVKEVLGHISDSERIFAYRALRIARADATPLSGFEQDDYVRAGAFGERSLADLAEEFALVRSSTSALFHSLGKEAWLRRGTANKNEVTVRALAFIIAGHELHHRDILKERYFPAIPRA